jgi:hypothetical protein
VLQGVGKPIVVVRFGGETEVAVHDGGLRLGENDGEAGQTGAELGDRDGGGQVEGAHHGPVRALRDPVR